MPSGAGAGAGGRVAGCGSGRWGLAWAASASAWLIGQPVGRPNWEEPALDQPVDEHRSLHSASNGRGRPAGRRCLGRAEHRR